MVALLFALMLIGLTAAALVVAGLVVGVVTGIVALNSFVLIVGVARRRSSSPSLEPPPEVVKTQPITGRQAKASPAPSDVSHIH
jgi:MFS superfamily sulfate permease-like transporter